MALITRLSRLFRADVNAVLERMEEPELLLKQAIREMEDELECETQRAKLIEQEVKQLKARQNDLDGRLKEVGEELDLCFSTGNDDLARVLLKRKLESERFVKFLNRKRHELQEAAIELAKRIDDHRARLEGMRQKAELFVSTDKSDEIASAWTDTDYARQFAVSDDDVELAFLRERQKRVAS